MVQGPPHNMWTTAQTTPLLCLPIKELKLESNTSKKIAILGRFKRLKISTKTNHDSSKYEIYGVISKKLRNTYASYINSRSCFKKWALYYPLFFSFLFFSLSLGGIFEELFFLLLSRTGRSYRTVYPYRLLVYYRLPIVRTRSLNSYTGTCFD